MTAGISGVRSLKLQGDVSTRGNTYSDTKGAENRPGAGERGICVQAASEQLSLLVGKATNTERPQRRVWNGRCLEYVESLAADGGKVPKLI